MPKHDNPHRHTAYNIGREDFLNGILYRHDKFKDAQRQSNYTCGYNQEMADLVSLEQA